MYIKSQAKSWIHRKRIGKRNEKTKKNEPCPKHGKKFSRMITKG